MQRLLFSILALVLTLAPSAVHADLVLQLQTRDLQSDAAEVETTTLYLSPTRFAADNVEPDGARTKAVFDSESKTMWFIEHDSKSYTMMDEQGFRGMAAQFEEAMRQMQEQLEGMPPEQRRQVEEMMQSQMPGMSGKKHTLDVVATDRKETIQGKACMCYEVRIDGGKVAEFWVTSWKEAGVPKGSLEPLYGMARFFADLAEANPMMSEAMAAEGGFMRGLDQIDGFPVRIVDYSDGQPDSETLITSVEQRSLASEVFEVPAGYRKRSFDDE